MNKFLVAGFLSSWLVAVASAQDYTVLKTFAGSDGGNPYGNVLVDGGKIYGMTQARATLGMGTVFSMDLNGSNYTILHSFTTPYSATDGAGPWGDLIRVGDSLYGMTYNGGANQPATGSGVVFRVDIDGSDFTLLHTFSGSATDGSHPYGSLSFVGGNLYGMTGNGGISNTGAIFQMDTNGGNFSLLGSFVSGAGGSQPYGDLLAIGDRFYGTTSYGGSNNVGTLFSIGTNGTGFTVLHDFKGGSGDGAIARGSLVEVGGALYGVTDNGGSNANRGTIFRINTDGTGYQIIHNFAGGSGDGMDPYFGDLVAFGDTLYGLTGYGGTNNYGTLFELNTNGTDFLVLHSFRGGGTDGRWPYGGLDLADGVLYGMTPYGGPSDVGTVFSFVIPEAQAWAGLALAAALLALRRRKRGRS
ncbi:MAG TPA: hypothetical protein PLU30_27715 [Verrucomicrobiae bacterium]|nr:hypothetical protein [Verrucomicrobiae bacterium]